MCISPLPPFSAGGSEQSRGGGGEVGRGVVVGGFISDGTFWAECMCMGRRGGGEIRGRCNVLVSVMAHRHSVVRCVFHICLFYAIRFQSEWFAEDSDRTGDCGCCRFGTASCCRVVELRGSR